MAADGGGEGQRRIDPVAVHADVGVAPVAALDREPVGETVGRNGVDPFQHSTPSRDLDLGATLKRSADPLYPQAPRRPERGRLVPPPLQPPAAPGRKRPRPTPPGGGACT